MFSRLICWVIGHKLIWYRKNFDHDVVFMGFCVRCGRKGQWR